MDSLGAGPDGGGEGLHPAQRLAKPQRRWALTAALLSFSAGVLLALVLLLALPHVRHGKLWSPEAAEGGSESRQLRADLPSFIYDPLSEQASGMPGIPMGTDDDPLSGVRPGRDPSREGKPGCCSFEEVFGGLCYKRCSILTNGTFTNRVAPNTCCKATAINCMFPSNLWVSGVLPGSGFIVDGDGSTPHPLGICDGNEELYGGMCYKRCSLLTNNEFPVRSATNTCCKKWPCLWAIKTKGGYCSGYGIGGGSVPKHRCGHMPTVV